MWKITNEQATVEQAAVFQGKREDGTCAQNGHEDLSLILPLRKKRPHREIASSNDAISTQPQKQRSCNAFSKILRFIGDKEFILKLREYGWKYNSRLMTLERSSDNEFHLLVQMDELKNMIEHLMIHDTFLQSDNTHVYDHFTQNLEENILLYRIQRQIYQVQSVNDTQTEFEVKGPSQAVHNTRRIEKRIPKFHHGTTHPLINTSIILQLVEGFNDSQETKTPLHFELKDEPSDPLTWMLSIRKTNNVEKFCSKLKDYILSEISSHNLTKLVQNPRSFEFDVKFKNRELGIELCPNSNTHTREHEGVWVSNLIKGGQAQNMLGKSTRKGAAIR